MAPKSTGTLTHRCDSLKLYLQWAVRSGAIPFPIRHDVINDYLRDAAAIATTRGQHFKEALSFMGYHFDLPKLSDLQRALDGA